MFGTLEIFSIGSERMNLITHQILSKLCEGNFTKLFAVISWQSEVRCLYSLDRNFKKMDIKTASISSLCGWRYSGRAEYVLAAEPRGERGGGIPQAASPLAISGSAAKSLFRAPRIPPATQATL